MGSDNITGGLGNDYIVGGAGNDSLYGSDGNDFINGGVGSDILDGGAGNDTLTGGQGNDTIFGGAGDDTATFNVSTDGADSVDLGDGSDLVNVVAAAAGQVRLSFTSAEVGNGNINDGGTLANQDSGFAVRLQAEGADDTLTGAVSRFDDEGITFAAAPGTTFDVRDLVSGVQRGDGFEFVTLATSGNDTLAATQDARPYYINGGMGADVITGGSANDFLVGGAGNDALSGGAGNDTFIGGGGNDLLDGGSGIDRAIFAYTLGSATLGRSADGYVTITGAEGTDTLRGIEQFQFSDRTVDVADGSPLVDDLYYLNRYGDVAAAGQDADAHYAAYGAAEGRDPNAFFSTSGYRTANQDAVQAGTDALSQYRDAGFKQGRDPGASFDNEYYLARNPDVAAAGLNPLQHYIEYGQAQGRSINEAIGRTADLKGGAFDAEFYLLSYSDVAVEAAKTGDSFAYARNHFEQYGWKEGRDPNAVFEAQAYLNAYTDVAGANINPLTHYDQYGWKEGRDPSVGFDSSNYLKAYGDVTLVGLNPMQHFLQYGLYEGRSNFADGTFGGGLIG
ncbi:hypothetical protein ASF52_20405 [Methylobacterium sp. Leaf112]|nr:hypothetical protein ASF52_20405 [Methylobacterium sp. Leaf112]